MEKSDIEKKLEDNYKESTIIVNAREKQWYEKTISFKDVVVLAFGIFQQDISTMYTVVYKGGEDRKKEGTMVLNDEINVKNKMIFNVTATSKS